MHTACLSLARTCTNARGLCRAWILSPAPALAAASASSSSGLQAPRAAPPPGVGGGGGGGSGLAKQQVATVLNAMTSGATNISTPCESCGCSSRQEQESVVVAESAENRGRGSPDSLNHHCCLHRCCCAWQGWLRSGQPARHECALPAASGHATSLPATSNTVSLSRCASPHAAAPLAPTTSSGEKLTPRFSLCAIPCPLALPCLALQSSSPRRRPDMAPPSAALFAAKM